MKKTSLLCLASAMLLLTSCTTPKRDDPSPKDDSKIKLTLKQMNCYYYSGSNKIKFDTYFRDDSLTQFPYVSLEYYYKMLTGKDLRVRLVEKGLYEVTAATGEVATINTIEDTLSCSDYENFISTTIYRQDNVTNVYFDGAPYLRIDEIHDVGEITPTNISFKDYNINLIGRDDRIYLPLVTASNMYMGPTMITCFYDKLNVYFIDPNDPLYDTSYIATSTKHTRYCLEYFQDGKRSLEDALFSYGEMCFLIDMYYGLPGREYLHEELKELGLDQALQTKNDMTRKCREFLMSTKEAEYYAGQTMLGAFLYDAGHTLSNYGISYAMKPETEAEVSELLNSIGYSSYDYRAASNYNYQYLYGLYGARPSTSAKDNGFVVSGDTLLFRFDSFDYDIHEWNKYYENPGVNTLPTDPVTCFKAMLDQYEGNKSIKNVVVDITTNGGGYADVVCAFLGLMGIRPYQHIYDTISKNYQTTYYGFDANFDGVFDERDQEVKYSFNFAILTSACSFSCGNLLPASAKENGIMTLGDKSGGGSCAVIDAITAEGHYVRLSCPNHMAYLDGSDAEFGVPVDYELVTKDGGNYDFSKMYNISEMSKAMNEFYTK